MITFTPYIPDHGAAVQQFAEIVNAADGVEAFGEQTIFNLTSADVTHVLLTEGETVIGYAQVDRGSAELAVHPDHRRKGYGGQLLDAVKQADPAAAIWAHGDLEGAQSLARSRNLVVTRELLYMVAPLASRVVPPAPEGITVSTYTAADADDWLAVNAAAFADHPEQGRLGDADLGDRTSQPWFNPENFWLARDEGGDLAGYMWVKREGENTTAEIYVLGVSPDAQGRGLGKFLTEYAMAHMATRGVTEMDLYVEGDNHPALATYAAYGFTRALTHVQYL